MRRTYQTPQTSVIELDHTPCLTGTSQFDGHAPVGGDADPDNHSPWN